VGDSPSSSGPSRRAWLLGGLGITAGVALAVWFGLSASLGHVTWQDIGATVVNDRVVEVDYQVHREPGRAVVCTLEAQDLRHARVGTTQDRIPASPEQDVRRAARVPTTTRAVTGAVVSCEYAGAPPRS
jgi:hypothetical protein